MTRGGTAPRHVDGRDCVGRRDPWSYGRVRCLCGSPIWTGNHAVIAMIVHVLDSIVAI